MKMQIVKGSKALIKWGAVRDYAIVEGKVLDAKSDCVEIEVILFRCWPIRVRQTKWYSFNDPRYKLIVKQVTP